MSNDKLTSTEESKGSSEREEARRGGTNQNSQNEIKTELEDDNNRRSATNEDEIMIIEKINDDENIDEKSAGDNYINAINQELREEDTE